MSRENPLLQEYITIASVPEQEARKRLEEEIRKIVTNDRGEIDPARVAELVINCMLKIAERGGVHDVYELPSDHPERIAYEESLRIRRHSLRQRN